MSGRIKRAGVLLLSAILLCGMVSCGKEETKIQVADDSEKEPEYLSFFSADSLSGSNVAKYWSDCFAEEYTRPVYIEFDGASYYSEQSLSYRELLEKRLQSNTPDDLYIINAEDVIDFAKKGYWMDLSGVDAVNNLTEAALQQSTYDGKVFSIPLSFTGFGFYWNVSMLEEYNLTVPENLEEFLHVCETLKAEGITPYGGNKGYALTVPAMCAGMAELYGSDEKEQLIEELSSGEVPVSTYMRKGYEFLAMMIEKRYLDAQQALNTVPEKEIEAFKEGKYAFICTGLGAAGWADSENRNFDTEMTGLPILQDGSIAVYGADLRLCVNPKSSHLETALDFVEMIGSPEALDKSAELYRGMSSAKESKLEESSTQNKLRELLRQPGQIPNQDFALHFNTWESIRDLGRELCNGISVDEVCRRLDEKQRQELEEYK